MVRRLAALLLAVLLTSLVAPAQTSHRQPNPKQGSEPNVFDQIEQQGREQRQQPLAWQAAREQRKARLAELDRELVRLLELAQDLQRRLKATDLDATLPADLSRQAQELERVARSIHKHIRSL